MAAFKADASTMNALINALGAVVICTVRQLPADRQKAFSDEMARLAKNAESRGDQITETLLIDLHRAASIAPPSSGR